MRVSERSADLMSPSEGIVALSQTHRLESTTQELRMLAHRERELNGRNSQALLIAPNPESKPSTIVPKTFKRDNVEVLISVDSDSSGSGT